MQVIQIDKPTYNFQAQFHQRWGGLNDAHVRALAWLLDAPDLLDPQAPQWQGKIATLQDSLPDDMEAWLFELDRQPEVLYRYLDMHPFTRLGRYAEKLIAFYLEHRKFLVAHSIQVRADKNNTIGEFDYLLRMDTQLIHWEFATKFYLLEPSGVGDDTDYFVGPNLADTLGAKMHKIFDRQLQLSTHPAAQIYLPEPVSRAQALVKGWLFYSDMHAEVRAAYGTSAGHCRGFWCALSGVQEKQAERYAILPRLQWLAPAKLPVTQTMDEQALQHYLSEYFAQNTMPVLVALLEIKDGLAFEVNRGFIVPGDWRMRAGKRISLAHQHT